MKTGNIPASENETLTGGIKIRADGSISRPKPSEIREAEIWKAGDLIDGRYEVKEIIGRGGMGVVYRFFHREWNTSMGVKVLLPTLVADEISKKRFIREAQTWIDLGMHPNIVQCWYVREIEGLLLLFLEYIQEGSLKKWCFTHGVKPGDWPKIIDLAIQASDGLGYAHEQGLVHRDVKPANLMMAQGGRLCVTDFGLVKVASLTDIRGGMNFSDTSGNAFTLTTADSGMGTPEYAAPEQWTDAKDVDGRADIYGLGIILFELCCGRRPFDSGDHKEPAHVLIGRHLSKAPPDPVKLQPYLPKPLAQLILDSLAKDPEERPETMLALREALCRIYETVTGKSYPRARPVSADLRADSLNNKAVSLWDLNQKKEAITVFKKAIEVDPRHLEATGNLGFIEWSRSGITDYGFLERLRGLENVHAGRALYWRTLGEIHLCRRSADEAVQALVKAAELQPDDPLNRQLLSKARREAGSEDRHIRTIRNIGVTARPAGLGFCQDGESFISGSSAGLDYWQKTSGHPTPFQGRFRSNEIDCIAVNPSLDLSVSGNRDNTIRLWDVKAKECIRIWKAHQNGINCISFVSETPQVLSGGSDGTLRLWWNERNRTFSHLFETAGSPITCIAMIPDGKAFISGSFLPELLLWDLETKKVISAFQGHTEPVTAIAALPDGKCFISGSRGGNLRLWEIASGKCLRVMAGNADEIIAIVVSPDGKYMVSGGKDNTLRLLSLDSGVCLRTIVGHFGPIRALAYSSQSRCLISGGEDKTIRIWNIGFDQWSIPLSLSISEIKGFQDVVKEQEKAKQLLRQAEADLLQGRVSEAVEGLRAVKRIPGFERDLKSLSLWNEAALSCARTRLITAWPLRIFQIHKRGVNTLHFSPDGRYGLSAGVDGAVKLIDPAAGKVLQTFSGHSEAATSATFSRDGKYLLSGSADRTMRLWSVKTGKCEFIFSDHQGPVTEAIFCPDGRTALSVETGGASGAPALAGSILRLWDIGKKKVLHTLAGSACAITCAAVTPDNSCVITGGRDFALRLWDLPTGECLRTLEGHTDAVTSIAVTPEGEIALSAGLDGTLRLWELSTGKEAKIFKPNIGPITALSICDNGRIGVVSGGEAVRVIKLAAGASLKLKIIPDIYPDIFFPRMEGHTRRINSVAISPDGRFVLSGGMDKSVWLWELEWDLEPGGTGDALHKVYEEHLEDEGGRMSQTMEINPIEMLADQTLNRIGAFGQRTRSILSPAKMVRGLVDKFLQMSSLWYIFLLLLLLNLGIWAIIWWMR